MHTNISLNELNSFVQLLSTLKHLDLLQQQDLIVTWEKRPAMIIDQVDELEVEYVEEVFGCNIDVWNPFSFQASITIKFKVSGA